MATIQVLGQEAEQRTISTVRSVQTCTRWSPFPPFLDTIDVILQMLEEAWDGSNALAWVQVFANPLGFLGPISGVGVQLTQNGNLIGHQVTNEVGGVVFSFKPASIPSLIFTATATVLFADGELACSTSVLVRVNPGKAPEVLRMTIHSRVFDPLHLFNFTDYLNRLEADLRNQAPDAKVLREESSFDGTNLVVVIESPAILILILAIFIVAAIIVFLVWMLVDRVDAILEERGVPPPVIVTGIILIGAAAFIGSLALLVGALGARRKRVAGRLLEQVKKQVLREKDGIRNISD